MEQSVEKTPQNPSVTQNPVPPPAPSHPGHFSKKGSMIIGGLLIILLAIGVWLLSQSKPSSQTSQVPTPSPIPSATGLMVAQRIGGFLDKAASPDGSFIQTYICSKSPTPNCKSSDPTDPPRFGFIALAYYNLYTATNNPTYLQQEQKTLAYILDRCDKEVDFCDINFPPLYQLYKYTNDQRIKAALLKVAPLYATKRTLEQGVLNDLGLYYSALYDITGDKKYKDWLIQDADDLYANAFELNPNNTLVYKNGTYMVRYYSAPIIKSYYIPAYMLTRDPRYLHAAEQFFDNADIVKNFGQYKDKISGLDLITLEPLITLTSVLTGTEKQKYQTIAQKFAQLELLALMDNPENIKYTGDNGFLIMAIPMKWTIHNAWRLNQFLSLKDFQFALK